MRKWVQGMHTCIKSNKFNPRPHQQMRELQEMKGKETI